MTEIVKGKEIDVKVIGHEDVKELFGKIRNGQIFTAVFIKKDGSERVMNCRRGVKKDQVGRKLKYNPDDFGLMSVFDMQKKAYRMLDYKTTTEIRANKKRYLVGSL